GVEGVVTEPLLFGEEPRSALLQVEPGQAHACGEPQEAVFVAVDGAHIVVAQKPIGCAPGGEMPGTTLLLCGWLAAREAAAGAHPERALCILVQAADAVVRQAARLALRGVVRDQATGRVEPVEAFVGA